ncbi:MAG: acetyl-CoA carboxylase biotin carboxyl carrier protein [Acutalibacteraceae bacterium]
MYSIDEIKALLAAFNDSKATELEIKNGDGEKLLIKQSTEKSTYITSAPIPPMSTEVITSAPAVSTVNTEPTEKSEEKTEESAFADAKVITSPMVGVFYAAPSPDSEPYVTVGSTVKKGDVLCLIEAMKLMNEIQSEQSGEIVKICVENGQVVEYGQPLFMVK